MVTWDSNSLSSTVLLYAVIVYIIMSQNSNKLSCSLVFKLLWGTSAYGSNVQTSRLPEVVWRSVETLQQIVRYSGIATRSTTRTADHMVLFRSFHFARHVDQLYTVLHIFSVNLELGQGDVRWLSPWRSYANRTKWKTHPWQNLCCAESPTGK